MPDPLSPSDIARRTFDVARRGYEQQEVRGFLHEVSALVERLVRTETELRERAERAEARLSTAEKPDEAMLLEVLGEETTRVLTSAREAAAEIRVKAEEAAARLIADATGEAAETRASAARDADSLLAAARGEADQLLEQARTELDRRSAEAEEAAGRIRAEGEAEAEALREQGRAALAEARAEGEADREASRQEGRRMVAEAQAVRERVLRDLAVRRKRSRQQVEKLNAGRERLLEAYDVVRRTVDEATSELSTALVDARIAADAAARRVEEEPEPTLQQLDEEVANAGLVDLPIADLQEGILEEPGPSAPSEAGADDATHEALDDDTPGPFSGEVPAMEPAPAGAAEADAPPRVIEIDHGRGRKRRKKGFDGLPPAELTVVEPPAAVEGVRILAEPAAAEPAASETEAPEPEQTPEAEAGAAAVAEPEPEAEVEAEPEGEAEPDAGSEGEAEATGAGEAPTPTRDSKAIFARLRADQDEPGATAASETEAAPETEATAAAAPEPASETGAAPESEPGAEEPAPSEVAEPVEAEAADASNLEEARPFAARASALDSVAKDLSRRLKRALADEQNEVLDLLRRAKPKGVDDLLPDPDEHAGRWADAAADPLREAAEAGADWSGGTPSSPADLADELARSLTAPLRERMDRTFAASDGNLDEVADRVRALYREWKGKRLADTTSHYAAAAYARGVFDGISVGGAVHWVVDPAAGPCPDCDDNVLAGTITKGEEFPTGNVNAPAHPGCHCLVLPAEG